MINPQPKIINNEAQKIVNLELLKHPELEDSESVVLSLCDFAIEIVKFKKNQENKLTDGTKIYIETSQDYEPGIKAENTNPTRLEERTWRRF